MQQALKQAQNAGQSLCISLIFYWLST